MTSWDDYFWPGTQVLANKLGERDPDALLAKEAARTSRRAGEIAAGTVNIPRTFDAQHLKALHGYLFQDVYDWAGQYREVDMFKGRLPFATTDRIDSYLADAAHIIASTRWPEVDRSTFVEQSAKVYAHVNMAHAFREGNGRTGKVFMSQLAEQTQYDFNFQAIDPAIWNQRSEFSRPDPGKYTPLHQELVPVFAHITVDRPSPAPHTELSEAARRAARYALRDHPNNPRRTRDQRPPAGQGPASVSYRPPAHYRTGGRDTDYGR